VGVSVAALFDGSDLEALLAVLDLAREASGDEHGSRAAGPLERQAMAGSMGELTGYLLSVAGRYVEEFDGSTTASVEEGCAHYDGAPEQPIGPEKLMKARATDTEAGGYNELLLNIHRVGGELV